MSNIIEFLSVAYEGFHMFFISDVERFVCHPNTGLMAYTVNTSLLNGFMS